MSGWSLISFRTVVGVRRAWGLLTDVSPYLIWVWTGTATTCRLWQLVSSFTPSAQFDTWAGAHACDRLKPVNGKKRADVTRWPENVPGFPLLTCPRWRQTTEVIEGLINVELIEYSIKNEFFLLNIKEHLIHASAYTWSFASFLMVLFRP